MIPAAIPNLTLDQYFMKGVGQGAPEPLLALGAATAELEAIISDFDPAIANAPFSIDESEEFMEGGRKIVLHTKIERNRTLTTKAKAAFKNKHGKLFCEVCEFDFANIYGDRGKEFIEAHHRTPIAQSKQTVTMKIKDLAMVCSNCHRMLHRKPWLRVQELRSSLRQDY